MLTQEDKEDKMNQLAGKIALVTGASRGIGKAIAIALAKEGANIVIAARDVKVLDTVAKTISELGVKVEAVPTDVTKEEQIKNLFAKAMQRFGRLDVLVNNAGVFGGSPIENMTTEAWDNVIATDLRAPFICTREAFKIMKSQGGGRIINVSSISAFRVRPNNAPYSAAKSGLIGLTETTALEGRSLGINCCCVYPGEVEHEPNPNAPMPTPPPNMTNMPKMPSMKTEECAAAVVFMASQPPHVNVLSLMILPREQPYLARG
jgi:NAD(P)-dependent dehydrogenase (short-subunit alcohol dehydrogenase family)